tara:strand:- start:4474 stop:5157 length:684 start_codon:yes stop_codon:yes gene_type:complete
MIKFYRIVLLILALIVLTTFNPIKDNINLEKKYFPFKIENIYIENNSLIDKEKIKKDLNDIYNKNIFFLKEENITQLIGKVDFLDRIEVKKIYPDTIIIKIFETEPVAVVFKNGTKYLLDSSSQLISIKDKKIINKLPNIFGKNSEKKFIKFFNKLKKNRFPYNKVKNYYYFQINRWDLQLTNNKIIKLPHQNVDEAIIKSIKILDRDDFKNYNIVDLRVDGKIIVE